jgi:hypothetical protein
MQDRRKLDQVRWVMFEDHVHLFPRAEDESVRHFAIPFLKLMFAHANFEGVFRDLQNVVAKDDTFSENNGWSAKKRPEKLRQLMIDHGCQDAEIATANRVLTEAFRYATIEISWLTTIGGTSTPRRVRLPSG